MFTKILFIYFNTTFIHKNWFRGAVPRDCSGNHNFSWHLIHECKQVLIRNIRFSSFSIYPVILQVNRNVKGKIFFILPCYFFPYCFFTILNWRKFLLFIILLIDKRLIPVCLAILWGTRYRWAIITYEYGIHELPHELPNDLRFRILGK